MLPDALRHARRISAAVKIARVKCGGAGKQVGKHVAARVHAGGRDDGEGRVADAFAVRRNLIGPWPHLARIAELDILAALNSRTSVAQADAREHAERVEILLKFRVLPR